jgi:hypothetical protein
VEFASQVVGSRFGGFSAKREARIGADLLEPSIQR